MTSLTNQVLRSVAIAWFKVLYSCLKYDGKRNFREFDEESGYGSDGQENSFIARAEYTISCADGVFKGTSRELPTTVVTKSLEQKMEYLLLKNKGHGEGYFAFTYRVGFSDRPSCLLEGNWQSLIKIGGLCKVLALEYIKGTVDFKSVECMRKNRSPLCEDILFTVEIRLFVREACMFSDISSMSLHPILLNHLASLTMNLMRFGSENNPRAITKKSEFDVQSLSKFSTGSKYSSDLNILAAKCFVLKWKALWVELCESKGVSGENGLHDDSLRRDFKRVILQIIISAFEEKGKEEELRGSFFLPEASDVPLTPFTSEDSPFFSPPLSPVVKALDYNNLKSEEPMHHVRQILQTDLPAKRTVEDNKNGSPQSSFEAPIIELTPPDSPVREDSSSPSSSSPPAKKLQLDPLNVRSLKDHYSNDGETLLATYTQFSSALKHFGHSVFEPVGEEHCPYEIDLSKSLHSANEFRALANSEPTGKPEGKSKLFGTWTTLTQDTQSSGVFVDEGQYSFYANENCCLEMVKNLLKDFSDSRQI